MIRHLISRLGNPFSSQASATPPSSLYRETLEQHTTAIRQRCTDCGACTRHCAFLGRYGSPLSIALQLNRDNPDQLDRAFGCSLCGLCTAVCPQQLDPCSLFLDMRRRRVALGTCSFKPYKPLLTYEALGTSRLFSWFGLPPGCNTVFFPGCALPGTRPAVTLRMFQQLRSLIPNLGIVLKCCTKPSHDLGRSDFFQTNFRAIAAQLRAHGITTLLTACPNCTKIFRQYAPELTVHNTFTLFAEHGVATPTRGQGQEIALHDPCPLRDDQCLQEAVRSLVQRLGYIPIPMPHQQNKTICCGEGGAVGFIHPEFSQAWTQKRVAEADGRPIISSCAGCSAIFSRSTQTIHLADLLFPDPLQGKAAPPPSRPPFTYFNRLWLKFRLKRLLRP